MCLETTTSFSKILFSTEISSAGSQHWPTPQNDENMKILMKIFQVKSLLWLVSGGHTQKMNKLKDFSKVP